MDSSNGLARRTPNEGRVGVTGADRGKSVSTASQRFQHALLSVTSERTSATDPLNQKNKTKSLPEMSNAPDVPPTVDSTVEKNPPHLVGVS